MTRVHALPTAGSQLSPRARLLVWLERWFSPLTVPAERGEHAAYEYRKAAGSYGDAVDELGGLAGKRVLDFGCGWGGETVWLAERAEHACGCDIDADSLADARAFADAAHCPNASFHQATQTTLPFDDDSFDAVLSTNVFEHVMQPTAVLRELHRVLRPGGSFITRFGPLFHSPLGYHLPWVTQVPWAHLLLGLRPIIEVRNTRRAPIDPASWADTGLNGITFACFKRAVRDAGFDAVRLRRVPVRGMRALACVPGVGNLFTFGIDCRLEKAVA